MKLISCYIAGFGKFINRSFDFSGNVIEMKEQNGWGKTTLADFLKCMLYGMDGGRIKSVEGNERIKYRPWQGERFGGVLTVECGNKTYRIERSFGKTASNDEVKVYDENNMPCFSFGESANKIGETLFGLDGESFRRSVYIPQGGISTGSLPDTMKNRLLALFTDTESIGAEKAIERLETAERSLRSKRRPAKGKLDELDERLEALFQKKEAYQREAKQAAENRGILVKTETELAALHKKSVALDNDIERINRVGELRLKKEAYIEAQERLQSLNKKEAELQNFFGDILPKQIQITALENAVKGFYEEKQALQKSEESLLKVETLLKEKELLKAQYESESKAKESYQMLLKQKDKKNKMQKKEKNGLRKVLGIILCVLSLSLLGLGIWFFKEKLIFSIACILGSALGFFLAGLLFFRKTKLKEEDTLSALYADCEKKLAEIEGKLLQYSSRLEIEQDRLNKEILKRKTDVSVLEEGLRRFFERLRLLQANGDYRFAVVTVKEKLTAYEDCQKNKMEYEKKLRALSSVSIESTLPNIQEKQLLKAEKADLEKQKEELLSYRAKLEAEIERFEEKEDFTYFIQEETLLKEEKSRLEKRLTAIRAAKTYLLQAKENLAAKYLSSVEKKCVEYLQTMGAGLRSIRYAATGETLLEADGQLRSFEYCSAGEKELVGFCTRIALVETLFEDEKPVLILDDPFVNLDDERTKEAKMLIKELCQRYQILYFTCKNERSIV